MRSLQKWGGVAALYEAAAYVVGIVGFLFVVDVSAVTGPSEQVALLADNQLVLSALHIVVYVVWGMFMVVLSLALYDRLKSGSPGMAQVAAAIGVIWAGLVIASGTLYNLGMGVVIEIMSDDPAQAATVWVAIRSVVEGLSGVEIVGGTWILLMSLAALRAKGLPKILGYLGVAIGAAGLLTAIPPLFDIVVMVYALGQIVWFAGVGIVLLRSGSNLA